MLKRRVTAILAVAVLATSLLLGGMTVGAAENTPAVQAAASAETYEGTAVVLQDFANMSDVDVDGANNVTLTDPIFMGQYQGFLDPATNQWVLNGIQRVENEDGSYSAKVTWNGNETWTSPSGVYVKFDNRAPAETEAIAVRLTLPGGSSAAAHFAALFVDTPAGTFSPYLSYVWNGRTLTSGGAPGFASNPVTVQKVNTSTGEETAVLLNQPTAQGANLLFDNNGFDGWVILPLDYWMSETNWGDVLPNESWVGDAAGVKYDSIDPVKLNSMQLNMGGSEDGYVATYHEIVAVTDVDGFMEAVHVHSWAPATCTAPKTCRTCGETEGTAAGHAFTGGVCSACGMAQPDAVSTQTYNGRVTFAVYAYEDGTHRLEVSGTGVMPTAKQAAGYKFFDHKSTIKEIAIGEGITTVGYGIFSGFTALSYVSLPSTLTTIDGEAFKGCTGLKAIDIPDSVTTLGYMAFSASGLESVVVPASVTSIKNYVFYRCKSLVSAEIYGTTEYKVGARIYYAPGARMFSECSKLENIVLGDKITLLNTYCFHGTAIPEFTVPARVKFVYDAAFHSCTKMTKFVMEEGVTYLGWAALFGCSSLTDVSLPSTITGGNIATWAFGACTSLESIELPSNLTNLKKRTFSGCTALKSIELPETVTTLGDRVFIGCTALESVKLSNITKIDVQTFNNCRSLSSITIPETVTSIGDLAFRLNENLKTVYIDSATIAAGLTGNAVYGNLIKWAETIAIRSDITNVPAYVKTNYPYTNTVVVDGKRYTTYGKTAKTYNLKAEDYILDAAVHTTKYDTGGFVNYTDFGRNLHSDNVSYALAKKSIEGHGLGSLFYAPFDGDKTASGEWGYAFLNLNDYFSAFDLQIKNAGWIVNKPANDVQAVEIMKNWLFEQFAPAPYNIRYGEPGNSSINGHTLFEHYVASWGYEYVGAEIGENIAAYQAHMAFTRGAARQYGTKPIMYFSNWNQGTIGTWETQNSWPDNGLSTGGHSMSLLKRAYMMSYMGGAASFTFEAGGRLAFYGPERMTTGGLLELSPYGQAMQELVAFSEKNSDIGINYAPIGVALDYYHGLALYSKLESGAGYRHDKAFGYFDNTAGDDMNWQLFSMLYNGAGFFTWKDYYSQAPEQLHQRNTPYGDTHDVIMHTASQQVLNSYPVILLSGDVQLTTQERNRYINYVKQGGTLLLNTAYLSQFSRYAAVYTGGARQDVSDGKGKVIIYGPDYSVTGLDSILKEQLAKYIPFTISDEVQYLVNVKDGSLILTVINNDGVTKAATQAPVVDYSKAKTLTINYTGNLAIKQVKELYYGETVSLSGNTVTTTIGPGDYRVFEFVFD